MTLYGGLTAEQRKLIQISRDLIHGYDKWVEGEDQTSDGALGVFDEKFYDWREAFEKVYGKTLKEVKK